jgi:hypothetical protein
VAYIPKPACIVKMLYAQQQRNHAVYRRPDSIVMIDPQRQKAKTL